MHNARVASKNIYFIDIDAQACQKLASKNYGFRIIHMQSAVAKSEVISLLQNKINCVITATGRKNAVSSQFMVADFASVDLKVNMGSENEWGDEFLNCNNPVVNQGHPANFLLNTPTRPKLIALIERLIAELASRFAVQNSLTHGLHAAQEVAERIDEQTLEAWQTSENAWLASQRKEISWQKKIIIRDLSLVKENLGLATQQYLLHLDVSRQEEGNHVKQFFNCLESVDTQEQFIALINVLLRYAPKDFVQLVISYIFPEPMLSGVAVEGFVISGSYSAHEKEYVDCDTFNLLERLRGLFPRVSRVTQVELDLGTLTREISEYTKDVTRYQLSGSATSIHLSQVNKIQIFKLVFVNALDADIKTRDKRIYNAFCEYEMRFAEPADDLDFNRKISITN